MVIKRQTQEEDQRDLQKDDYFFFYLHFSIIERKEEVEFKKIIQILNSCAHFKKEVEENNKKYKL